VPWVRPLTAVEPMPPLGVLDAVAAPAAGQQARLRPGQTLLLHTDGAEEARDAFGAFFALARVLGTAARLAMADGRLDPALLVSATRAALLEHVGGRLCDDVALLALTRDPAPLASDGPGAAQLPAAGAQL
jgi:serine phosphatase RsbU (regulator of sigma subunit)